MRPLKQETELSGDASRTTAKPGFELSEENKTSLLRRGQDLGFEDDEISGILTKITNILDKVKRNDSSMSPAAIRAAAQYFLMLHVPEFLEAKPDAPPSGTVEICLADRR